MNPEWGFRVCWNINHGGGRRSGPPDWEDAGRKARAGLGLGTWGDPGGLHRGRNVGMNWEELIGVLQINKISRAVQEREPASRVYDGRSRGWGQRRGERAWNGAAEARAVCSAKCQGRVQAGVRKATLARVTGQTGEQEIM